MIFKGTSISLPQKTTLVIAGCVLGIALLIGTVVAAVTVLGRLDRVIDQRGRSLQNLMKVRGEVQTLQQQIRRTEEKLAKTAEASPVTFVEGLVNRIAGKGNLAYLKPLGPVPRGGMQVEALEMKIERQPLDQLLRLFWELENTALPMHVTGLRLQRRFDNHALVDATLTLDAYRL